MYKLFVFGLLLGLCGGILGHTYHLGACPQPEYMPGFEMNKFLGIWYVIQKTSTASHCITYNFTRLTTPGQYQIEQISQHFILGLTPLKHEYKYTGILSAADWTREAQMTVKFPLKVSTILAGVAGSASYTVVATDYTTYAAVFTCQKLAFAHRRSATILSRSKNLDKIYVDKMRTRLSSFGLDPYDLSIISQSECPALETSGDGGVNININPDTFSSHNIGEAVRKTGGVIADGVEYAVETGKKVYHKVASSKEELTETPYRGAARSVEADAEWLP